MDAVAALLAIAVGLLAVFTNRRLAEDSVQSSNTLFGVRSDRARRFLVLWSRFIFIATGVALVVGGVYFGVVHEG